MSIDEPDFHSKNLHYIDKMLSRIPFKNVTIDCDSTRDCNGRGKCKKNITNYYDKCDCNLGF